MSARPIIGRTADHRGLRPPRTLTEAFGPHATYNGLTSAQVRRSLVIDRINGVACAVIAVCLIALTIGGAL